MTNEFGTYKQAKLILRLRGELRIPLKPGKTEQDFIDAVMSQPQDMAQRVISQLNEKKGFVPTLTPATTRQISWIWNLRSELGISNKVDAPTAKTLSWSAADQMIKDLRSQVAKASETKAFDALVDNFYTSEAADRA
jgi:hypothetical protein